MAHKKIVDGSLMLAYRQPATPNDVGALSCRTPGNRHDIIDQRPPRGWLSIRI